MLRLGDTPLREVPGYPRHFAKLESYNTTGSMKLRSVYRMLTGVRKGSTVVESTSGNMGVALAAIGYQWGLRVVLVTDPKLSSYHRVAMEGYGAEVQCVEEKDETGGWLLTRLARVRELCTQHPEWYWPNQYENPLNPAAFEKIGDEIAWQLRACATCAPPQSILWFFAAVSTGGSLTGTARALLQRCTMHYPKVALHVVAVDVEGSVVFGGPAKPRHLNGIGSSLKVLPNLARDLIDDVVMVMDAEAVRCCYTLRDNHGMYVGGSSGAVWAAVLKKQAEIGVDDIVVVLFPDAGHIYTATIYSRVWLQERQLDGACV